MNIKILFKQHVIVITSCILVACAAGNETTRDDQYAVKNRGSDCISQGTIRDYAVLDDSNLIVTAVGRRKYHIILSHRAFGLRSNWQIGFMSPTGQICSAFSDILVDDGFRPERIRIASIRKLTPEDENELLIRFGKKEPEFTQAPATQEVEGAEVEELD